MCIVVVRGPVGRRLKVGPRVYRRDRSSQNWLLAQQALVDVDVGVAEMTALFTWVVFEEVIRTEAGFSILDTLLWTVWRETKYRDQRCLPLRGWERR